MKTAELVRHLKSLQACQDAVDWAATMPSYAEAWRRCPRGDWLLWLAERSGVDRKTMALAACDCAETALRFVPEGEGKPGVAIEMKRSWCRGEATVEQVEVAADAHCAAAYAASCSADAAYAADAAYCAAVYSDDVYYAAAYAADAYAYAYGTSREKALRKMATIVRRRIKRPELGD